MDSKKINSTAKTPTQSIAEAVDKMMKQTTDLRKPFGRRWYDNNFFDDGFHYRYIQRSTGRMVDLSSGGNVFNPYRTIPKASKQIRSIANTLLQNEYRPVVYPRRIIQENYARPEMYQQALLKEKDNSKKVGLWLQHMWEIQRMKQEMAWLFILAAKHGVSWLKIWPDKEKEMINQEPMDAFDIYVLGDRTSMDDLPFLIEAHRKTIAWIKSQDMFDEDQLKKISPDNKYASDEIKDAYGRSRYGQGTPNDFTATLILKEAFIKEYLNEDNRARIQGQKDSDLILKDRQDGDEVIRHVFVAGNIWLYDKYVPFKDFPYIPLQLEPGPFYQTPLIERFMSVNKTLDMIVSRVERIINTTAVGAWLMRKGENFQPTNIAGGIKYEYETTPPTQLQVANLPGYIFEYLEMLDGYITEQGMMLAGNKLPKGKNSAQAIEAMKANEVNNIKMIADQWNLFIKNWATTMLMYAEDYFIKPQDVTMVFQGQPTYFDVIGQSAFNKMRELGIPTNHLTPISSKYSIEIRAESGLGYTPEAKKAAALQLFNVFMQMSQAQMLPPQVMQQFVQNLLEAFNFGNTQEFMEGIQQAQGQQLPPQIIDQMKLALAQVMKDIMQPGQGGQPQPGLPQQPQGQPQAAPQPQPAQRVVNNPIASAQPKPMQPNNVMNTLMR